METRELETQEEEESEQVEETTENNEDQESEGEDKDAVIAKLTEERDNYKRGLLAAKSKRTLDTKEKKVEPADTEKVVLKALQKQNEQTAIADVLDPDSSHHIEECVDSENWKQIIGYLPQNADRSTTAGVRRALKVAVMAWRADTGQVEKKETKKNPAAEISALGGSEAGSGDGPAEPKSTLKIPKKTSIDDWFPKD